MRGYIKTFKVKDGRKGKSNKLISFSVDDEKLLEKYKAIWTKIEDLKNVKLNALLVYDDKYIKTKIRRYGYKICTNFSGLNVPEDDVECKSCTVVSIDSLLVYKSKYFLYVYRDNCVYKITKKGRRHIILMTVFVKIRYYKCCMTIELIQAKIFILLQVIEK